MGEQRVHDIATDQLRELTLALLDDLDALEHMIDGDLIETGVRRIGAEQEMFLVDSAWRPAPVALKVLAAIEEPQFTTELASYNIEVNLDPLPFEGNCLSAMLAEIDRNVSTARAAARDLGARVALTGILPTLRKGDLGLENMTPRPRYFALNDAMNAARGDHWNLHIRGLEELASRHDSVMLESCCTSFQAHLQVEPAEFAHLYNLAQALTAPVLAAAVNSPVLFGRRLWQETRIPVFQQSIDTRRAGDHVRQAAPRVRYGERWLDDSILEVFREDAVRFRALLTSDASQDPFAALAAGEAPRLLALALHNGTVYRWNRACYGVSEGRPHLRIELRVLPSGPSTVDEMANAAFFFGLLIGLPEEVPDVRRLLRFDQSRANFQAAAKRGLDAQLVWFGGERVAASDLILENLLPVARHGLAAQRVDSADIDRLLGIIEARVRSGQTGARWQLGSWARLGGRATRQQVATALTASLVRNQERGIPVHEWPWAELHGADLMSVSKLRVEDIMTTDLYTVGPEEPIDLVGKVMEWKGVRHTPVEDRDERLVGMLSCFHVLKYLGARTPEPVASTVADLMTPNPPTVGPTAPIGVALAVMREQQVDCLPVVAEGNRLVGIVTERDFIQVVGRMIEQDAPKQDEA